MYIDTAYTSKSKDNDASAIIVAGKYMNSVYIKKAFKFWLEFPELIKKLKEIQKQYNIRILFIENKASGLSIKQQLSREGFNCADLSPKDKDKVTRCNAVTPSIEGGHLWFIQDNWNEMVMQELTSFPYGHDDLTDVVVYSIDNLLNKSTFNYSIL
jgi:predicted phage terminase large subunit-like protein